MLEYIKNRTDGGSKPRCPYRIRDRRIRFTWSNGRERRMQGKTHRCISMPIAQWSRSIWRFSLRFGQVAAAGRLEAIRLPL